MILILFALLWPQIVIFSWARELDCGLCEENAISTTASNLEDSKSCDEAWSSWTSHQAAMSGRNILSISRSTSSWTTVWETIERFGPGKTSTDCDDIPRFSFDRSATSSATKTVTQSGQDVVDTHVWWPKFNASNDLPRPGCRANTDFCEAKKERLWRDRGDSIDRGFDFPYVVIDGACGGSERTWCRMDYDAEVVLLYWPPKLENRDICTSDGFGSATTIQPNFTNAVPISIVTSAITFEGQDIWESGRSHVMPWTLTGPFTLRYPTVYLAHHPLTRYDITSKADREYIEKPIVIRTAGIMPVPVSELYTYVPDFGNHKLGLEYAKQMANGQFHLQEEWGVRQAGNLSFTTRTLRQLNLGHLQNPIPASIYYDARLDCTGFQSHCGVITDDTYRPSIVLKNKAWHSILPDHFTCGMGALNDPPRALTAIFPQTTVDQAALPTSSEATPGLVPAPALSVPTSIPDVMILPNTDSTPLSPQVLGIPQSLGSPTSPQSQEIQGGNLHPYGQGQGFYNPTNGQSPYDSATYQGSYNQANGQGSYNLASPQDPYASARGQNALPTRTRGYYDPSSKFESAKSGSDPQGQVPPGPQLNSPAESPNSKTSSGGSGASNLGSPTGSSPVPGKPGLTRESFGTVSAMASSTLIWPILIYILSQFGIIDLWRLISY
jgi:hypothetical protein